MLESMLIGAVLLGATVLVHAIGSTYWLHFLLRGFPSGQDGFRPRRVLAILMGSAVFFLALHVFEILMWALTYLALPGLTEIETLEQASYFSFVTFTTLGYGDITLEPPWRVLSGIEAMDGILLVGWTTAMLFSAIQRAIQVVKTPRESS
jgi:hypothetical protein